MQAFLEGTWLPSTHTDRDQGIKGDFSVVAVSPRHISASQPTASDLTFTLLPHSPAKPQTLLNVTGRKEFVFVVFISGSPAARGSVKREHAVGWLLLGFRGNVGAAGRLARRQGVNTAAVPESLCFTFDSFNWQTNSHRRTAEPAMIKDAQQDCELPPGLKSKAWKAVLSLSCDSKLDYARKQFNLSNSLACP